MSAYAKPKNKPGMTITAVWHNRDGSLRWVKYEPTAKASKLEGGPGECSQCGRPGPAFRPCKYCELQPARRSLIAAERRGGEPDLFG